MYGGGKDVGDACLLNQVRDICRWNFFTLMDPAIVNAFTKKPERVRWLV